jgi:hypothetical protein
MAVRTFERYPLDMPTNLHGSITVIERPWIAVTDRSAFNSVRSFRPLGEREVMNMADFAFIVHPEWNLNSVITTYRRTV